MSRQERFKDKSGYTKKPMRSFFTDLFIISLLVLAQIILIIYSVWNLSASRVYLESVLWLISFLVVLFIINKRESASYKLAWAVPILLFPAFGGIFYIFCQGRLSIFRFKKRIEQVDHEIKNTVSTNEGASIQFQEKYPERSALTEYLKRDGFPMYTDTDAHYFSSGEALHRELLLQLKRAKDYIFLEFFIIHEGEMWDSILEILKEKAAQGVDIRVMYDGMGSVTTLPSKYDRTLESYGIRCQVFNRFVPVFSTMQNNRDHRKIVVIDGKVAFTGGVNLSDEYINAVTRFGHWKDAGIMVEGAAAVGYTMLFLRSWNIFMKEPEPTEKYLTYTAPREGNHGYFQPYCDSPFDDEAVARNVYLNLINRANRYIYIMTPYLILDEELDSALKLAAKSGIDVRIITPHHADKKYVHLMTRNSYPELIKSGIKIYEYEPGFLHSKNILVDDSVGVIGSVNFDYRSLYLHFECAQLFYDHKALGELKDDFDQTFPVCLPITEKDCKKDSGISRIITQLLKLFAPLF